MAIEGIGLIFMDRNTTMEKRDTQSRRNYILEKTLKLFKEKGYYGISVGDIAKACDMARGSLYTHFESKQELVNELYVLWKERLFNYVRRDLAGLEGRELHQQVWTNLFAFAQDHTDALVFLEAQHHAPYLSESSFAKAEELNKISEELYMTMLGGEPEEKQELETLLSVSYGGYTQIAKMANLGKLNLNDSTFQMVEAAMWQIIESYQNKIQL